MDLEKRLIEKEEEKGSSTLVWVKFFCDYAILWVVTICIINLSLRTCSALIDLNKN